MARQTGSATRGVGWDKGNPGGRGDQGDRGALTQEGAARPGRVLLAEVLAMFEVSKCTWNKWKRWGWVPQGERAKKGLPKWYDRAELEALLPELGPPGPPYEDPGRPGVWRVPLTTYPSRRRERRREVLIDAADLPIVEGRRWGWMPGGSPTCMGHVAICKRGDTTPLHRLILGVDGRDKRVIHLNRDPLDCRRANLEVRSVSGMVVRNRKMKMRGGRPCSSRFKGVCFARGKGKWKAQIKAEGRVRHVGYFDDEVEAAEAYDRAAWEAYGREAYLNFPPPEMPPEAPPEAPPEVAFGQVPGGMGADTGVARRAA